MSETRKNNRQLKRLRIERFDERKNILLRVTIINNRRYLRYIAYPIAIFPTFIKTN